MNHIWKPVCLGLLLAAAPAGLAITARPALAQSATGKADDPAVSQIQDFYDALVASMKAGGTAKSRYDKLKPAVEKAFDLQAMTAAAVGPSFAAMSDADKKALVDAFTRMTVANYAKNFDSYNGEKFPVEPKSIARGNDHFVKSKLVPSSGETVAFIYRMHQADGAWKVIDVYLAGNISQMAQKRSDFASTLKSGGPEGLAKKINALADQNLS
jgi:phospholipid transport system substrate-binding protein